MITADSSRAQRHPNTFKHELELEFRKKYLAVCILLVSMSLYCFLKTFLFAHKQVSYIYFTSSCHRLCDDVILLSINQTNPPPSPPNPSRSIRSPPPRTRSTSPIANLSASHSPTTALSEIAETQPMDIDDDHNHNHNAQPQHEAPEAETSLQLALSVFHDDRFDGIDEWIELCKKLRGSGEQAKCLSVFMLSSTYFLCLCPTMYSADICRDSL